LASDRQNTDSRAAFVAAVLWFVSSSIEVPDNVDTFIGVLQRIGYRNSCAARASCVAALFGALDVIIGL